EVLLLSAIRLERSAEPLRFELGRAKWEVQTMMIKVLKLASLAGLSAGVLGACSAESPEPAPAPSHGGEKTGKVDSAESSYGCNGGAEYEGYYDCVSRLGEENAGFCYRVYLAPCAS